VISNLDTINLPHLGAERIGNILKFHRRFMMIEFCLTAADKGEEAGQRKAYCGVLHCLNADDVD
jgi:hypothetical protein